MRSSPHPHPATVPWHGGVPAQAIRLSLFLEEAEACHEAGAGLLLRSRLWRVGTERGRKRDTKRRQNKQAKKQ